MEQERPLDLLGVVLSMLMSLKVGPRAEVRVVMGMLELEYLLLGPMLEMRTQPLPRMIGSY